MHIIIREGAGINYYGRGLKIGSGCTLNAERGRGRTAFLGNKLGLEHAHPSLRQSQAPRLSAQQILSSNALCSVPLQCLRFASECECMYKHHKVHAKKRCESVPLQGLRSRVSETVPTPQGTHTKKVLKCTFAGSPFARATNTPSSSCANATGHALSRVMLTISVETKK